MSSRLYIAISKAFRCTHTAILAAERVYPAKSVVYNHTVALMMGLFTIALPGVDLRREADPPSIS